MVITLWIGAFLPSHKESGGVRAHSRTRLVTFILEITFTEESTVMFLL